MHGTKRLEEKLSLVDDDIAPNKNRTILVLDTLVDAYDGFHQQTLEAMQQDVCCHVMTPCEELIERR